MKKNNYYIVKKEKENYPVKKGYFNMIWEKNRVLNIKECWLCILSIYFNEQKDIKTLEELEKDYIVKLY